MQKQGDTVQRWEIRPLGDVVKPSRPRIKPSEKPDLPFIGMEHVEAHTMKLLGTVPASTMKSSAVHFQPGDVLYGRLRPYLNKVYRPDFEGLCSAEFIVFPKSENVDSRYLQYFLNSSAFVSFASHLNTGDRPRVDFEQLSSYEFPLALLDQQKLIVAEIEKQFSRLDEAVANLKRVKANLKRYKAAVLKAAVEGRLVETEASIAHREGRSYETGEQLLQCILEARRRHWKGKGKYKEPVALDVTKLPDLPEGWVWATVEQLGAIGQQSVLTGPFGSNMGKADFQDSGVAVLTIGCLQEAGLDISKAVFVSEEKSDDLARYKLAQGDMLFSRMASVGRAGLVTHDFEGALFNYHIMRLRLESSVIDNMLFIYYVRGSKSVQDYVREVNHGATRDGINTEQLLNMPVAIPPFPEQHRIVAEVDRGLSLLREIETQTDSNLKRTEKLRQAILVQAFSGNMIRHAKSKPETTQLINTEADMHNTVA